jgi:SAM-dependent methyltransferase
MHVFSTKQAKALLESAEANGEGTGRRWFLDVGAGCGEVTATLAKHFEKTCATESSSGMAARLRTRGFDVVLESDTIERVVRDVRELGEDLDEDGFDVVAALNLCDRIDAPVTLMSQLKRAMKPGSGILILAIVVPFRPFVEGADGTRTTPSETVDAPSSGSWEAGVEALWENLIAPAGFELIRLSRVPYISEGDHHFGAYVLDDAVFVLRAPAR